MGTELREKDFKLGCFHGKLKADQQQSEAHIQRIVYLSQRICITRSRTNKIIVRLIGYEIPLTKNRTRGNCVDIMGYDEEHNLYVIELKKGESNERIEDVNRQVNAYAEAVKEIQGDIEKEFEGTFFFPIEFTAIKKMIIAPRGFYKGKSVKSCGDIEYGYFVQNINRISIEHPVEVINIHIKR